MTYPVFYPVEGDTLPIFFDTFAGSTGASITMTGLTVTDVEIFKDGSVTQRASDAGYTLLDTDGIDFDGITGIHGFSIDLNDNTDAGFYEVGPWYHVIVSTVTVDSQTVSFIAAAFRIVSATRGLAGTALPAAAADAAGGLPISDAGGLDLDTLNSNVSAVLADTGTDGVIVATNNDKTGYSLSSAGIQAIWDALTSALTTVGSIGKLLVDNINATISSRSSHTAANVRTEMDSNSTQLAAIVADTNELQTDWVDGGRLDLILDARASQSSVNALNDLSAAQVNAEVVDALATDTYAEPAAVPAATASLKDKIGWLAVLARNKITQTSTTQTLRNDADNANIATSTVSDDSTTATRGEWS